ncbi:DUF6161 domain-containing protein [Aliarcobacter butzleri]|uniref:DUF6161 domain-containing protein n=1 Tax=Aliarcobacter butzleri TaxID=28197 RepID=UPI003AF82715
MSKSNVINQIEINLEQLKVNFQNQQKMKLLNELSERIGLEYDNFMLIINKYIDFKDKLILADIVYLDNLNDALAKVTTYIRDERFLSANQLDFINKIRIIVNYIDELENLKDKNYELIGQISELKNMYEKRENEFSQISEVLEKSKTLESEFYNAKEAVLKNIELKQATTYWEKQAINYNGKYKFYFWANIIVAVILIISAFLLINKSGLFIQNITVDNSNAIESLKNLVQSVPFFNYVIFILYTTLVIWIMKILVKIMLSNYHLAVDANERIIMINTYLVLLEDGKGFQETDRKVILDNIFRQTNHGIITDETSVTVADIVSSFKK